MDADALVGCLRCTLDPRDETRAAAEQALGRIAAADTAGFASALAQVAVAQQPQLDGATRMAAVTALRRVLGWPAVRLPPEHRAWLLACALQEYSSSAESRLALQLALAAVQAARRDGVGACRELLQQLLVHGSEGGPHLRVLCVAVCALSEAKLPAQARFFRTEVVPAMLPRLLLTAQQPAVKVAEQELAAARVCLVSGGAECLATDAARALLERVGTLLVVSSSVGAGALGPLFCGATRLVRRVQQRHPRAFVPYLGAFLRFFVAALVDAAPRWAPSEGAFGAWLVGSMRFVLGTLDSDEDDGGASAVVDSVLLAPGTLDALLHALVERFMLAPPDCNDEEEDSQLLLSDADDEDEEDAAWKASVAPCAQRLLAALAARYPAECAAPVVAVLDAAVRAPLATPDALLAKDAAYHALGIVAPEDITSAHVLAHLEADTAAAASTGGPAWCGVLQKRRAALLGAVPAPAGAPVLGALAAMVVAGAADEGGSGVTLAAAAALHRHLRRPAFCAAELLACPDAQGLPAALLSCALAACAHGAVARCCGLLSLVAELLERCPPLAAHCSPDALAALDTAARARRGLLAVRLDVLRTATRLVGSAAAPVAPEAVLPLVRLVVDARAPGPDEYALLGAALGLWHALLLVAPRCDGVLLELVGAGRLCDAADQVAEAGAAADLVGIANVLFLCAPEAEQLAPLLRALVSAVAGGASALLEPVAVLLRCPARAAALGDALFDAIALLVARLHRYDDSSSDALLLEVLARAAVLDTPRFVHRSCGGDAAPVVCCLVDQLDCVPSTRTQALLCAAALLLLPTAPHLLEAVVGAAEGVALMLDEESRDGRTTSTTTSTTTGVPGSCYHEATQHLATQEAALAANGSSGLRQLIVQATAGTHYAQPQ